MRRLPLLLVVFMVFAARPAVVHAWNPLTPLVAGAKKLVSVIVGGFVESATAPTIHNLEDAGKHLLADADTALGKQLDHAGTVTSNLIAQTDKVVADKLDKIDHSLEARIVQVNVTADEVIDRSFGRLDRSIGRIDDVARKRIDQIGKVGNDLIKNANADAVALLKQADAILTKHIEDVRQIVSASIQQVDEVVAARIAQVDEVAGRRIGNIDVIATKQSLGLEVMLLRLAAMLALVGFIGFVLWRFFVEAGDAWEKALDKQTRWERVWATLVWGSPRFGIQLALAFAGAGLLYFLSGYLPKDASSRVAKQVADHKAALDAAIAAYDFTGIRYHNSQLQILDPALSPDYEVRARKAELVRNVLSRPALLQTASGIRQVAAETTMVEQALKTPDPDILALEGFVQWQVATTRRDEFEAATLCARALQARPSTQPTFMLSVLARNYLRMFFHDPYTPDQDVTAQELASLRAAVPAADSTVSLQFQHVIAYDTLVAQLDTDSTTAYLEMLDAQVELEIAHASDKQPNPSEATQKARERRTIAARKVVDAWRVFDGALETSPWLVDEPTSLAAFTLDDSVLSHALYFVIEPNATELLPELVDPPAPSKHAPAPTKISETVRVKIAPLRVAWARRYATLIGPKAQEVVAFEETQRFIAFERRSVAFEHAYVAFAKAARASDTKHLSDLATSAIRTASEMQLYRGDARLTTILIDEYRKAQTGDLDPALLQDVSNNYQRRRLRFL